MKSHKKGDFHVRFCGNAGVKFPCMTRLAAMRRKAVQKIVCRVKMQQKKEIIKRKVSLL